MKLAALLLACTFAAAAHAQTTWKGLHFGQSRDDVRAQLAAQNIAVEASQEGSLQSTVDYELALPALPEPLPMLASFHFTPAGALMDVTLTLDVPGMRRYWASLGSDDNLLAFAAERLAGALSGKYGAPLYRSAACDSEAKQAAGYCVISWHGPEQSIHLEHVATPRGPRLLLRYQPLATDL